VKSLRKNLDGFVYKTPTSKLNWTRIVVLELNCHCWSVFNWGRDMIINMDTWNEKCPLILFWSTLERYVEEPSQ